MTSYWPGNSFGINIGIVVDRKVTCNDMNSFEKFIALYKRFINSFL